MSLNYENKELNTNDFLGIIDFLEIIDFHVHTFPDHIASKAVSKLQRISGLAPSSDGTLSDTLAKLAENHINKAVLLNIATAPTQQISINNLAWQINQEYSNKLFAFGSVHFMAEDALTELERIKSLGIKGIKLHPDYQEFMINDKALFPIYEKCEELGLVIVFHSGWDCYSPNLLHAKPIASKEVIRQFPNLKIVLAHFGGIHCWDDVERYLVGENVYFDTAMCHTYADKNQIERMIKNHDVNKILLGSDCPWENQANSIEFILSMNLSNQIKKKILGENAKVLLQIDE